MSSKLVKGKDVMVYEVDGATDRPIICSRSCTINKAFDVKEKTSIASLAKEYVTGMYGWDISLDGVVTVDAIAAGQRTVFDFFDGTPKAIKATFTDGTVTKTLTGTVIVPAISLKGDVSDFAGYTLEMRGTGELTIS